MISLNRRLSTPPVLTGYFSGVPNTSLSSFNIWLSANAGQRVALEASTNLSTWSNWTTLRVQGFQNFLQDFTYLSNTPQKFYRASSQPH
jgi:hypothetical protein